MRRKNSIKKHGLEREGYKEFFAGGEVWSLIESWNCFKKDGLDRKVMVKNKEGYREL